MKEKICVTHKSGDVWNNKLIEDYFLPLGYYVDFDEACAKGKEDVILFEINNLNPKELLIEIVKEVDEELNNKYQMEIQPPKSYQKLVFELQKTQLPHYEECHNYLGFNVIEIIEFNYDGKGNILVSKDGHQSCIGLDDLNFILHSGWYKT